MRILVIFHMTKFEREKYFADSEQLENWKKTVMSEA